MKNLILTLAAVFAFTFSSTAATPKDKVAQHSKFTNNHTINGKRCVANHRTTRYCQPVRAVQRRNVQHRPVQNRQQVRRNNVPVRSNQCRVVVRTPRVVVVPVATTRRGSGRR